ncbi:MAG: MATE family efflux transporter [Oscillospiraceae bacterium]|nr:MATE family efflux transporter [Oscillospiraceae bacterium]
MPTKHSTHVNHGIPLRQKRDVDMTEGSITRHIISFALPLLLGNIFQQLYNTVDTWVIGNYASNEAYSAVGTVGPVINMLIGFFMGLSSGAGVVISQYYGAHREEAVQKAVHTAIVMTLGLAVIFTALGLAITPLMLNFMKMPDDVKPEATTYLTIYFSGIIGLMLYNMGAGILRAVGDSQRPFYFLVVCAILNTVLDLVFVLKLRMGVAGVALATVISQCVSAILVIITLLRTDSCIILRISSLGIHWNTLKKIFSVGIPAALQMAITAFSNVFVQSYINYFGPDCMSGWTTYSKVDQLLFLPMQSIALASTTFVGQNLGSSQPERARRGVRHSLLLAIGSTVILSIPVILFAPSIVAFFNDKQEVVDCGAMLLRWLSPFYILCCFNQIYACALRGAGNSRAPMLIMISSFVVFRQVYLFAMARICNEIIPISMSYPAGWLLCSILTTLYYRKVQLSKTRLVEDT